MADLCPAVGIRKFGTCNPKPGSYGTVLFAESFGTFIFIYVIMAVVYYNGDKLSGPVNAAAVGASLFGAASTIGAISGGALNPAIGLALRTMTNAIYGGG